jgi:hypothetical protein
MIQGLGHLTINFLLYVGHLNSIFILGLGNLTPTFAPKIKTLEKIKNIDFNFENQD